MKILVALDAKKYSRRIIKNVARLAENTLADIVFLGVQEKGDTLDSKLTATLTKYQQDIYSYFSPDDLPYGDFRGKTWDEQGKGDWQITSKGLKECSLRVRAGGIAKQVVQVAGEIQANLVILGGDSEFGCEWDGEMNVPLRIAEDAPCSVLVIKESGNAQQIMSILDQSVVCQDALEMVNQLVTIHDADLKIVGVDETKESKKDKLEQRMVELLKYYNDRQVSAWVTLLDASLVQKYVTNSSKKAIVALWMGTKTSLMKRLFTQSMVDKLLSTSKSALLILR
jgi:hypothetical protein